MTTISNNVNTIHVESDVKTQRAITQNNNKEDDNIFAKNFRNAGMDSIADFLRDDWSANMARKMGFNDFADWIDNKPDENNSKDDNFISNIAREMVKHPVITIATIVGAFFAGKSIYKAFAQNKTKAITDTAIATGASTVAGTDSVRKAATEAQKVVEKVNDVPLKSLEEQIFDVNDVISKGIEYEKSVDFKNLEIFKNISDVERRKILTTAEYTAKNRDLLMLASGSKPAIFIGRDTDAFDCLRSANISVAELWGAEKDMNLIMNTSEAKKFVTKYRSFLASRFNMPQNSSADDIIEMLSKGWNNKLSNPNQYADVRQLLEGSIEKNAFYAQIYQDIFNAEQNFYVTRQEGFFDKIGDDLAAFKQALKDFIETDRSSYKNLPKEYKARVTEMIDSMTEQELLRKRAYHKKLFITDEYQQNELNMLKKLAKKLEDAQKYGTQITLD